MRAEELLSKLEKVRPIGRTQWLACCPAHADRSPSLAVREMDDGRVLIHCYAGCTPDEIVGALGLDMTDLFPPKPPADGHLTRGEKRPWPVSQIVRSASHVTLVAWVLLGQMQHGQPISESDKQLAGTVRARLAGLIAELSS